MERNELNEKKQRSRKSYTYLYVANLEIVWVFFICEFYGHSPINGELWSSPVQHFERMLNSNRPPTDNANRTVFPQFLSTLKLFMC